MYYRILRKTIPFIALSVALLGTGNLAAEEEWVVYGKDQHIVLVSGDEEYRSEESLPQFGKILAKRHGFKVTVLFAVDPETGEINPDYGENIPGLEALEDADLMVIATRFRNLPDEQMAHIDAYINSGKPVFGIRTATHAFQIPGDREYHHYHFRYGGDDWPSGFGKQVLGETWAGHHGSHSNEATRGRPAPESEGHPVLNGVNADAIFGTTNVYNINLPLPDDATPLVLGEVVDGLNEDDPAVEGDKNDPMRPIAWVRSEYRAPDGATGRSFASTIGASQDFLNEDLRRLWVNAVYHLLDLDVPEHASVDLVGDYDPLPFGFGGFREGVRPADHKME